MNPNKLLLLLLLSFAVISCKENAKETTNNAVEGTQSAIKNEDTVATAKHQSAVTTATFNNPNVAKAYSQYIEVKTALVNSNLEQTATLANDLMTTFANIGVEEEALIAVQMLKDSKTLDGQRTALSNLTPFMETIVNSGLSSGKVYKQYCPMALNNTGAYWLANTQEVRNPYFGDAMLTCGRVSQTLEAAGSATE